MEFKEYTSPYGMEGEISSRRIARHVALYGLGWWYRITDRTSRLATERVQFLYLHHAFDEEIEPLRRLMDELARDHLLIGYSEAVDRVLTGRIDRPYVCFSVDDGLKNSLQISRVLKEYGVSGCFFICPSIVGETDDRKIKEYCASRFGMPPTPLLSWNDVDRILRNGHEIGSHTMTHPVLSQLSRLEVEDEIYRSRRCLTEMIGRVDHFAWPRGRFFHFNPAAAEAVFDAGYISCASAERGCHVAGDPLPERSLCIRRDYVSARWPLDHVFYFMVRNCLTAGAIHNRWPEGWFDPSGETC